MVAPIRLLRRGKRRRWQRRKGDGEAHDEAEEQQLPGGHELNRGARPERLTEPRPTMTLQAQMDMGGIERFRRSGPLSGVPVARPAPRETG